jgi:hypothetical protein
VGLLSANLKAKIAAGNADLYWAVVLSLPSNTRRHSDHTVASATGGLFLGTVLGWTPFKRGCPDSHGHLEITDATIIIDDTDRSLAAMANGAYANSIRGSVATVYLAERTLAQSDWFSLLVGRVAAPPDWPSPNQAALRLVVNDLPLRAKVPALMTRSLWQYADDTGVVGVPAPEIYGRHDSRGQGDGGMVPTLLVDTTTNLYLVQRLYSLAIDQVYDDGLPIYGGYTLERVTRHGQVYTCLEFASTPAGAITCDMRGVDDTETATGNLITNPVLALYHWLVQIDMTCDTALFTTAAAWATKHGKYCSMRIAEQRVAMDILNDWVDSIGAIVFFTNTGKIGIAFDAHDDASSYPSGSSLIYQGGGRDDIIPIRLTREYDQIIDSVTGRYSFNSVDGDCTQTLAVMDPNLDERADEDYPMPASWAAVVV